MTAATRLPWMKWYPRDAIADPNLRACTAEARGVWYDLLWLMDASERRGYLCRNGQPWNDEDLCRVIAATSGEWARAKDCLLLNRVPSVEDGTGIWYSRRMARDEGKRAKCSNAGREGGGNPSLRHPPAPPSGLDTNTDSRDHIPDTRSPIKVPFIGASQDSAKVSFVSSQSVEQLPATPKRTRKPSGTPRHASPTYPPDFEAAWSAFGRYGSKPDSARYWRALPDADRTALVAAIPAYLRCVEAGRTKKQFEGWINPERRLWDMDWHAVHAEMTRPLAARPVERGSWTDNLGTGGL